MSDALFAEAAAAGTVAAWQDLATFLSLRLEMALALGWDQGAASRQCHCHAYSEGECGCGMWPSEPNPYRQARSSSAKGDES